ncbi:hypothetical protein IAR55_006246 [Kwoniella newhampshirensis]|uniref:Elongator complex protein 3 n=1 Tax=Kwoniella newhampshirensis TaxID=1651941 RepID=A0AAW0YIZ6_9TREE
MIAPPTSQSELHLLCVSAVVRDLINTYNSSSSSATEPPNVNSLRSKYAKKYGLKAVPRLTDVLAAVPEEWKDRLRGWLKAKPVRTASGVAVVAVMCKPHRCPHVAMTGNICVYCPGGPDSDFEYSTQSYTGYEHTSTDPGSIMGGTFMSMPEDYRHKFVAGLHNALSGHTGENVDESVKAEQDQMCGYNHRDTAGLLLEAPFEVSLDKVSVTLIVSQMLRYGCTRLEIGVQSVYEDVARDTNRGHTVRAVSESFHMSKDAGYKIVAHMMPDLPNCGTERDIWQFQEFFENPAFRSDGLKLYPTLVIRGTVDIVARIMALVPPWTRVYRVQRDIPMPLVSSGVENGNLRELALARVKDFGAECRDVRYREVGLSEIHNRIRPQDLELLRRDYTANGGWETFLSYEDPFQDILVGLLRLRKCSEDGTFRKELVGMDGGCSLVRELHVYGTAAPVHSRDPKKFQHQGIGTLLMEEAERIAREEHGSGRIAVISGVGTRDYYRRLGYHLDGPYMVKDLLYD